MEDQPPKVDLTGLISNYVSQIDTAKQELSKLRDMLQSIFDNDPTYQTHDQAVKEATKVRNGTKKQLMRLPQANDLQNRLQETRHRVKELNTTLSEYLQEYAKDTGMTSIETEDKQVRTIVYTARLVKSSGQM